tara:strand:+ start:1235 stop:1624 length:390 start_codon:yes stop_codon:yes gene_type:complete
MNKEWMVAGFTEGPEHLSGTEVGVDSPMASTVAICTVLPDGHRGSTVAILKECRGSYSKYEVEEAQWKKTLGRASLMAAAPVLKEALEKSLASMQEVLTENPPEDWRFVMKEAVEAAQRALKDAEEVAR